MGDSTAIAWTDHTFNPWLGCERVSPACQHCYAEAWAKRSGLVEWGRNAERRVTSPANWRKPLAWNAAAEAAGRPALVFCASLADVFEDRPELVEPRARLFDLIEATPHLIWQLLTKRPQHVVDMVPGPWLRGLWPENVWIGTTVEDQQRAVERIPRLLEVPAPVRFLSCEPLLNRVFVEPWLPHPVPCLCGAQLPPQYRWNGYETEWPHVVCAACDALCVEDEDDDGPIIAFHEPDADRDDPPAFRGSTRGVEWVICGGESGPGHRPLDVDHARQLRDQCAAAGVPYFFKQHGGRTPTAGGDLLDGVQHKAFPGAARRGAPA